MARILPNTIFKGPITSCEYLDNSNLLIGKKYPIYTLLIRFIKKTLVKIGCGPYLSLIDEVTLAEKNKFLALKYRVIHKIVKSPNEPSTICVFGQKALNLLHLNSTTHQFKNIFENVIELNDWIFDIHWLDNNHLLIVLAHNQCIRFNLNTKKIDQIVFCEQKCMLYSAKVIDTKQDTTSSLNDLIIASGTIYNQVLLWTPVDGTILAKLDEHQGVIFNICFRNGFLFSVSDDRSINVWKLEIEQEKKLVIRSSELYTRFYGHDARVWKCESFVEYQSG